MALEHPDGLQIYLMHGHTVGLQTPNRALDTLQSCLPLSIPVLEEDGHSERWRRCAVTHAWMCLGEISTHRRANLRASDSERLKDGWT